ncbi:protein TonB [Trichlorobacter thiogenes]|uniref:Protein TonB n=1 Tax=Trichlorobacter thiogenes TaxID=115783 RepID=A0A1T4MYW3_9BACT|nr:TonB family protein [Trichlorobacter thiogenes]SJZ71955.1 protein TonB [Trichlorobacter thiogenes]
MSSDQYVEKTFLYLLLISIVLHVAVFVSWYLWPKEQQQQISEPTFIDLQDMPELKTPPTPQQDQKARPSDQRRRVAKETAPRQVTPGIPTPPRTAPTRQSARVKPSAAPGRPGPAGPPAKPSEAGSSVNELLRRKPQQQAGTGGGGGTKPQPNLAPSASRMAKLEESYRRRFADDIDDGSTRIGLNTNDIQFGSFLKRFETAVYGVWRYPQEAALKGIEGVTPVKITFSKNGEIKKVQLLESSGSRVLDDEVFRTLRLLGPMGNFPKNYDKDEFHLIAFFQYGNARGRLR